MEKIAVHVKTGIDKQHLVETIQKDLKCIVCDKPDYVFTFGGDGTFLEAIQIYGFDPIYIPVNMGNLGFYTSWIPSELSDLLADLTDTEELALSTIKIEYQHNNLDQVYYALNEATIVNSIKTQILNINIDGFDFEKFRGTGICISTPTGSTAYNKSLGGSVVQSDLNLLQVTKIAPINNRVYRSLENSFILGAKSTVTISATREEFKHSTLTMDRNVVRLDDITSNGITMGISEYKVRILVKNKNLFWSRVKKAFL